MVAAVVVGRGGQGGGADQGACGQQGGENTAGGERSRHGGWTPSIPVVPGVLPGSHTLSAAFYELPHIRHVLPKPDISITLPCDNGFRE
ncbi:hypothetical protein Slala04_76360 [Streptomyces lavendulae subsp. lavendulae]|nr:hypothetical protein Slala04_76360 [Streptomyces lavendulae subsp. lavendulae]